MYNRVIFFPLYKNVCRHEIVLSNLLGLTNDYEDFKQIFTRTINDPFSDQRYRHHSSDLSYERISPSIYVLKVRVLLIFKRF